MAAQLAGHLKAGDIVFLDGDLGTGKTTWVCAMLTVLCASEAGSSPTFQVIQSYEGRHKIYHCDAYRLSTEDILDLDLAYYVTEDSLFIAEWGNRIPPEVMRPDYHIQLAFGQTPDERLVHITVQSPDMQVVLQKLTLDSL